MVNLLRWVGGLACLYLGLALLTADAQQVLPPVGPPTAIACAYNASPPTVASGNAIWVQCDTNGKLITSGSGSAVIGYSNSASVAIPPTVGGPNVASISPCSATCNFYGGYMTTGATAGWIFIINAISKPADGAITVGTGAGQLQDCISIPANASVSLNDKPGPPTRFSTGVTIVLSSTTCGTLTNSATAQFIKGSVAQ